MNNKSQEEIFCSNFFTLNLKKKNNNIICNVTEELEGVAINFRIKLFISTLHFHRKSSRTEIENYLLVDQYFRHY